MAALPEPYDVLRRIKRGLAGYVSYLAACEMNESFSEYILYEPILRILLARGYEAKSEVECRGVPQPVAGGDKKKLDFVAWTQALEMAIEVKWAREKVLDIESDILKLNGHRITYPHSRQFLVVFGKMSDIEQMAIRPTVDPVLQHVWLYEVGDAVFAEFGQTQYGCRVFELGPYR